MRKHFSKVLGADILFCQPVSEVAVYFLDGDHQGSMRLARMQLGHERRIAATYAGVPMPEIDKSDKG